MVITGTKPSNIVMFKSQMSSEFDMSVLGLLSYYEVEQGRDYIELKQESYARKIIQKAGISECKPVKFPMEPKIQLHKDEKGQAVDPTNFKSMVGWLRYLVHTQPDISYVVGVVRGLPVCISMQSSE